MTSTCYIDFLQIGIDSYRPTGILGKFHSLDVKRIKGSHGIVAGNSVLPLTEETLEVFGQTDIKVGIAHDTWD